MNELSEADKEQIKQQALSLSWITDEISELSVEDRDVYEECLSKILESKVTYVKGELTQEVMEELAAKMADVAEGYPHKIGGLALGMFVYSMVRQRFDSHNDH